MKKNLIGEELRNYNKQKVLEEAVGCLGEKGIHATKVSDIAQRAGVTTRSIERYYGGKENLLEFAAYDIFEKNFRATADNLKSLEGKISTGIEWMESFMDLQIEYFKEHFLEYMAIEEIEIYFYRKNFCEDLITEHLKHLKKLRTIVADILECGKKDGSIREDVSPIAVSNMINVVLQGAMMRIAVVYKNPVMEDIDFDVLQALQFTKIGLLGYLSTGKK